MKSYFSGINFFIELLLNDELLFQNIVNFDQNLYYVFY